MVRVHLYAFYDGGYGEMVNALDCGSSYCEFDPH